MGTPVGISFLQKELLKSELYSRVGANHYTTSMELTRNFTQAFSIQAITYLDPPGECPLPPGLLHGEVDGEGDDVEHHGHGADRLQRRGHPPRRRPARNNSHYVNTFRFIIRRKSDTIYGRFLNIFSTGLHSSDKSKNLTDQAEQTRGPCQALYCNS